MMQRRTIEMIVHEANRRWNYERPPLFGADAFCCPDSLQNEIQRNAWRSVSDICIPILRETQALIREGRWHSNKARIKKLFFPRDLSFKLTSPNAAQRAILPANELQFRVHELATQITRGVEMHLSTVYAPLMQSDDEEIIETRTRWKGRDSILTTLLKIPPCMGYLYESAEDNLPYYKDVYRTIDFRWSKGCRYLSHVPRFARPALLKELPIYPVRRKASSFTARI